MIVTGNLFVAWKYKYYVYVRVSFTAPKEKLVPGT
jgi:hypothetical protein